MPHLGTDAIDAPRARPPLPLWRINGLFLFLFSLVSFPLNTPFACLLPAPVPAC